MGTWRLDSLGRPLQRPLPDLSCGLVLWSQGGAPRPRLRFLLISLVPFPVPPLALPRRMQSGCASVPGYGRGIGGSLAPLTAAPHVHSLLPTRLPHRPKAQATPAGGATLHTCQSCVCLWLGTVPGMGHLRPGPAGAGSLLFLAQPSVFQRRVPSPRLARWGGGERLRENDPHARTPTDRHAASESPRTHRRPVRPQLTPAPT